MNAVGGKALTWTAHQTDDYFIDFLKSFGTERGEYVVGYAVAYITASAETKLTLALSTNDQGRAWLNGKPVFKFVDTRTRSGPDRVARWLDSKERQEQARILRAAGARLSSP